MQVRRLAATGGTALAAAALLAALAVFQTSPASGQPEPPREGQRERGGRPQFPPDRGEGFPPRGAFMGGGPAALAVQGDYVYVVRGNTLYQFEVKGLTLAKKVTLEEEPSMAPQGRPRGEGRGEPRGEPRGERPPKIE